MHRVRYWVRNDVPLACTNMATRLKSNPLMSIDVEVNLKIPRVTIKSPNEPTQVIDNSATRFTKRIQVPTVPKPGAVLQLPISAFQTIDCTVTRADWSDERELFIISCSYSKRSISADEYGALVSDSDWTMKPLI